MKVKVLASGSKGNSTFLEWHGYKYLIDIGITYNLLKLRLEELGENPLDLEGIFITHTHADHIRGLTTLVNKTSIKIYAPLGIAEELKEKIGIDRFVILEEQNFINDLDINLINTSHDAPCSVGYCFSSRDISLVYITDTGYINRKYFNRLKNKTIYILESNHDEEMLMNGPYPYYLKQRVVGDSGHLSNKTTCSYLAKLIGDNTKWIILAHISEKNNTYDLAYDTITEYFEENDINFHNILVAKQDEACQLLEVNYD